MSQFLDEDSTYGGINKDWDKNQDKKKPFKNLGKKFNPDFDLKDEAKTVQKPDPSGRHKDKNVNTNKRSSTNLPPFKSDVDFESLAREIDRFKHTDNKSEHLTDVTNKSQISGRHEDGADVSNLSEPEEKPTPEINKTSELSGRHADSGKEIKNKTTLKGRHDDSDVDINDTDSDRFNEDSDVEVTNTTEVSGRHDEGIDVNKDTSTSDTKTENVPEISQEQKESGRHTEGTDVEKQEHDINYREQSPDVENQIDETEKSTSEISDEQNIVSGRHDQSDVEVTEFDNTGDKESTDITDETEVTGRHEDSETETNRFEQSDDKTSNLTELREPSSTEEKSVPEVDSEKANIDYENQSPDIGQTTSDQSLEDSPQAEISEGEDEQALDQSEDSQREYNFETPLLTALYGESDNIQLGDAEFRNSSEDIKSDNELSEFSQQQNNFRSGLFPTTGNRRSDSHQDSELVNTFKQNEDRIYGEFSRGDTGLIGGIEIKPNDSETRKNQTKYDTRIAPVGSALRDSRRIANFIASPDGALFLTKQGFLQSLNPMKSTRGLNPSWLGSVVAPGGGVLNSLKSGLGLEGTRHGNETYEEEFRRNGGEIAYQVDDRTFDNVSGRIAAKRGLIVISRNMKDTDPDFYSSVSKGGPINLIRDAQAVRRNNQYNKSLTLNTAGFSGDGEIAYNTFHPGLNYAASLKKNTPEADSARINKEDASGFYDGTEDNVSPLANTLSQFQVGSAKDQKTQLDINDSFNFNRDAAGGDADNYGILSDKSKRASEGEKIYEKDAQRDDEETVKKINNSDGNPIDSEPISNLETVTISDHYSELMNKKVYGNESATGSEEITFEDNAGKNEPSTENYSETIKSYNTKNYKELSDISSEFGQGSRKNGYAGQSGSLETDYAFGNPGAVIDSNRYDDGIGNLPVLDEDDGASEIYNSEDIKDKYGAEFNVKTNKIKDFIPFKFFDVNNEKYLIFRATLTGLSEDSSPSWNEINYVGRPDTYYIYQNSKRSLSFDFKLYPNSSKDMEPMWSKLNYLTSLTYPHLAENEDNAFYFRSPFTRLTIGDMYNEAYGFISNLSVSVPEDGVWELGDVLGSDKELPKLPQYIDVSVGYQIIEKELPRIGGRMYDIPQEWRSY